MDSSRTRGPGQNKRFWIAEEDEKLIEALLEMHNEGRYKAEGNFKHGHLNAVEKYLEAKLPCSQFYVVHEMLTDPSCSGFGWDSDRKMVTAEKPIWDAYLQSHKDVAPFKTKAFPFYDELCVVFGKDRATGKDAENVADAAEEIIREASNDIFEENINNNESMAYVDAENGEFMSFSQAPQFPQSKSDGSSKKKRKRSSDDIGAIKEAACAIAKEMKDSSIRISEAMIDKEINERQMGVNQELMRTTLLDMFERHKAILLITRDIQTLNAFTNVGDEEKDAWVRALLDGYL
ncbi:hypothetical protein UlMin_026596 [Ulmus minor]